MEQRDRGEGSTHAQADGDGKPHEHDHDQRPKGCEPCAEDKHRGDGHERHATEARRAQVACTVDELLPAVAARVHDLAVRAQRAEAGPPDRLHH